MPTIEKRVAVKFEKAADGSNDAVFIMSSISPDRVNDTIEESAYLPSIGKTLIALWMHNRDQPIGAWKNLRIKAGDLLGDIKFTTATPWGKMAKQMIDEQVPLGASISFRGQGEKNKLGGMHFKTLELLECSIVTTPAHPRAMQIAKAYGVILAPAPEFTESQKDLISHAKQLLGIKPPPPNPAIAEFDRIVSEARAHLLANQHQLDSEIGIEIKLIEQESFTSFTRN